MSDLACWRCGEHFTVRVRGSEYTFDESELEELGNMLFDVAAGMHESLGEGYRELCADHEAQAKQSKGGLLAKLGLQRSAPIKRRQH